jgi:hypothetical protein
MEASTIVSVLGEITELYSLTEVPQSSDSSKVFELY